MKKTQYYTVQLIEKTKEKDDVYTFKFTKPNVAWLEGTNIHLAFNDYLDYDPKYYVRHFSIANLDTEDYIAITTKLTPSPYKSRLSTLNIGDTMIMYKLSQRMPLRYENRPIRLISMGVGIAAIKPMMEYYNLNSNGIKELYHISIFKGKKIYNDACKTLNKTCHIDVHTREALYDELLNTYNEEAIYYIVGSDEFLDNIITRLKVYNHPSSLIEIDKKPDKKILFLDRKIE